MSRRTLNGMWRAFLIFGFVLNVTLYVTTRESVWLVYAAVVGGCAAITWDSGL